MSTISPISSGTIYQPMATGGDPIEPFPTDPAPPPAPDPITVDLGNGHGQGKALGLYDAHGKADNRSGLGDGTNPGQGAGRVHSPNEGTDNPNNAGKI